MESETLARRKNVITLTTRGFSPTEIAEALNTSRETVYNDLRAIRESVEPELIGHTKKEILHGIIMTRAARIKELWRSLSESENAWVRIQAIKQLRLEDMLLLKIVSLMKLHYESPEDARKRILESCDYIPGFE